MKKIFAVLLSIVLMMSAMNVAAYAAIEKSENPVSFAVGTVEAEPGSEAHVELTIDGEYSASTLTVFVHWDSTKLTYASDKLTKGEVWMEMLDKEGTVLTNVANPGKVGFICIMPTEDFNGSGVLFGMDFLVNENIDENESIELTVEVTEFNSVPIGDEAGTPIGFTTANGSINVTVPEVIPVEFAVSSVEAIPGEDVTVAFTVSGEFNAHALTTHVYYDETLITPVGENPIMGEVWQAMLEKGGTIVAEDSIVGNIAFMCIMPSETFSENGTIFTMKFHVDDTAAPGTNISLRLEVKEFNSLPIGEMTAKPIPFNATDGSITVVEPPVIYTVQFISWDGTVLAAQEVEEGSAATAPEAPERIGYTFVGWDEDFTNVTSNLVVMAQYSQNEYTITYNVNGEFYATQTYHYGDVVTAPEYSVPTGYTFSGWDIPATMPAENLVLNATLTQNDYTITYNVNGEFYAMQTYHYGDVVTAPEYSVPTGYTFSGWEVPATMPAENLVLNATLTQNDYTITYNVNGEFYATQTYHYGDVVTAPEYSVPTGYTFSGWDIPATMPAENLVLNATLTQNDYTITYNVNGEFYATQTYHYGDVVTAPAYEVPTGYTFSGWDVPATMPAENLVVNATLTQNDYTITYNVNGEFYATQTYHYGDVVTAPEYSVPTGYTFSGWDIPATMPAENLVLNATLTQNDYTITYNVNGEFYATQTYHYGDVVTAPAYEVPTGYTFSGWDVPATMPAENLVVNATLTQNDYTITYNVNGEFYATQTYHYGDVVTAPEYSVPTGYTFSGWDIPATMPAENLVLNATLTINTYTVTFVDWDGELLSTQTVEHGSGAVAPDAPVRDNYYFSGWDVDFSVITCDLTVTALYGLRGDVDGDGTVTAADAITIMRMGLGLIGGQNAAADVNGDGAVNSTDALIAIRIALGILG